MTKGNFQMYSYMPLDAVTTLLLIVICSCLASDCCIDTFVGTEKDGDVMRYDRCESWRLNVEINNLQSWRMIPSGCESHVKEYVLGTQYSLDMEVVCKQAKKYAGTVKLQGDGKDVWVFDVDETALSNVAFYLELQFGILPFSHEAWIEWETRAIAPPIEPVKSLYSQLIKAHWAVFFLSGRHEIRRNVTAENLLRAGYRNWAGLILREEVDNALTAETFKSSKRLELEEQGYRIRGNIGDQWSDLRGTAVGEQTFKIPNPIYHLT